jgi:hypothetical protein
MISCGDDTDTGNVRELMIPETYTFQKDGVSTINFSGQTERIGMANELIRAMRDDAIGTDLLLEQYSNSTADGGEANPFSDPTLNASSKSIKSKVAASNDFFSSNSVTSNMIKNDFESWIVAQVDEVHPNNNQLAAPGQAGQIADGTIPRFVNAQGLEYNQAVTKSLIGALMIDQICNNYLSTALLDAGTNTSDNTEGIVREDKPYTAMEHFWDEAYGYLFGAATDLTDPLPTLGEGSFLNKYVGRVNEDPDFIGIGQEIFDAFVLGRAAIVAADYDLRDEQAELLKEKLSQVVAVRAVYYLQQGKNQIENGDFGAAFHDLSEGFGFVYSLRFTRQAYSSSSYFTNQEVQDMIDTMTAGNGFWDLDSATLDQLSEEIASKFDFTVAQAAQI